MLDRNGYAPSIISGWDEPNWENDVRHEVFYGTANRRISKEYGLWVYLSPTQHQMLHEHPNTGLDRILKQTAQRLFERYYTRAEFMALIGKNYLDEPEEQPKWDFKPTCGAERMQLW